jgi:hypothetical protein
MSKNEAAFTTFVAALKSKCEDLGIPLVTTEGTSTGLPENKGWVRLESAVNGHKLYVPKSVTKMGPCETTVPCQMKPGSIPMKSFNGKIQTKFQPDVELLVEHVLCLFADPEDRLPANKKPTRKAASEPTPATGA